MARNLATPTEAELGGPRSVLVMQRRDHQRLDRLLQRVAATAGAERQETLTALCRLVFPHAFAEEAVLWPLLRRVLPDGHELTLRVEQEHQEINELFTELETTEPDTPAYEELLERITALLRADVRDEEDILLPRLQQVAGVGTLRRVGLAWMVVRRTAPTRPHPVVARRPPGNSLAALPLSPLDRSRDRLDQLSRRAPGRIARGCGRVSRALAATAGVVEHLPPLRRGEDPSTRA
ncbi:hemerythrin domain-containing protein [Nocardia jiangsuensis]|uniref:Hemerythrin domain-containing protein n=1 Tax=Nocardia jiangsuensis TaxID=1691563 RepID=A0ABV8E0Y6_9NOCA